MDWIKEVVEKANNAVLNDSRTSYTKEGMGTTLVGVLLSNNKTYCFHLGDSRLYAYYDELICMTQDHTFAYELLKAGDLNEMEILNHPKRNSLTNALGIWSKYYVDINVIKEGYKYLVLCSDGLSSYVSKDLITQTLLSEQSVIDKVDSMIMQANLKGGYDNITVIIIENNGGVK